MANRPGRAPPRVKIVTMFWCCRRPAVSGLTKEPFTCIVVSSPGKLLTQSQGLDGHHAPILGPLLK